MDRKIEFVVIVERTDDGFTMRYDRRPGISNRTNAMINVLLDDLTAEAGRRNYDTTGPHRVVATEYGNDQWRITFDPIELTPVSFQIQ